MKNFEELSEFIKANKNWQSLLKKAPYSLKSISKCPYNDNWYLLMYNLFESDLSNPIVKQCRGTVVDDDGNIICAPYIKFFNYGDPNADEIDWNSGITVTEKIDGQLIKMFRHNGKSYWITNGGWDPTVLASERPTLLEEAIGNHSWEEKIPDGWTLMFELTSSSNKIVCKYDDKPKLWFHGVRDAEGNERSVDEFAFLEGFNYGCPKTFDVYGIDDILSMIKEWDGSFREGVVVEDGYGNRVKIKCEDYLKKKFEADNENLSSHKLYNLWQSGEYDDLPVLGEKMKEINERVSNVLNIAKTFYMNALSELSTFETRRDLAKYVIKKYGGSAQFYFLVDDTKMEEEFISKIRFFLFLNFDKYLQTVNFFENYEKELNRI